MKPNNPTPFVLQEVRPFSLIDPETERQIKIDVLIPTNGEPCRAIPHTLGYPEDGDLYGWGATPEEALADLLQKLAGRTIAEIVDEIYPRRT